MTEFSIIDLQTEDLDWFALDEEGYVGHFTSAGTIFVPERVVKSVEDLEMAYAYFDDLPVRCDSFMAPGAEAWMAGWVLDKESHYEVFAEWSQKGLYSFDCRLSPEEEPYFMVALPSRPLHERDLPDAIARYLGELRIPFKLSQLSGEGLHVIGKEYRLVSPKGGF